MIILCFRCRKEIESPNASNADYIIAEDTIVREPRKVLVALKHNQATLAKVSKILKANPELRLEDTYGEIKDEEFDIIEVFDTNTAIEQFGEDFLKTKTAVVEKDIQKTGVICPECYKKTDFVIWGVHK